MCVTINLLGEAGNMAKLPCRTTQMHAIGPEQMSFYTLFIRSKLFWERRAGHTKRASSLVEIKQDAKNSLKFYKST